MKAVFDTKQKVIIDLTIKQIIASKLTIDDILCVDADDVADDVRRYIKEGLSAVDDADGVASSIAVALDVDDATDKFRFSEVLSDKKRDCEAQVKALQRGLENATRDLRRIELVSEVLSELGRLPDDDEVELI